METAASPAPATLLGRVARVTTTLCALGYPIALVAIVLAFRYIGERWWVTLALMYLPRIGFALPLPFILAVLSLSGRRELLGLQALSIVILLFPLMGLNAGIGRLSVCPPGPAIRLMSCNVKFSKSGAAALAGQARGSGADLLLLQDAVSDLDAAALQKVLDGWALRQDGEFILATRYQVRDVYVPPALVYPQGTGGAHYVQYVLDTPLGLVDVFNVHPTSPRPGLDEVRGSGLRSEIVSGRLFAGAARGPVEWNAYRRNRQVAGIAERAAASTHAVIVAGDTNLPSLSWTLAEHLGHFRDAFSAAGVGFGYTFPARHPWMRIDRVLTNDKLTAVAFRLGNATGSDHRWVFAVLESQR